VPHGKPLRSRAKLTPGERLPHGIAPLSLGPVFDTCSYRWRPL
jgi:hypothetical protein